MALNIRKGAARAVPFLFGHDVAAGVQIPIYSILEGVSNAGPLPAGAQCAFATDADGVQVPLVALYPGSPSLEQVSRLGVPFATAEDGSDNIAPMIVLVQSGLTVRKGAIIGQPFPVAYDSGNGLQFAAFGLYAGTLDYKTSPVLGVPFAHGVDGDGIQYPLIAFHPDGPQPGGGGGEWYAPGANIWHFTAGEAELAPGSMYRGFAPPYSLGSLIDGDARLLAVLWAESPSAPQYVYGISIQESAFDRMLLSVDEGPNAEFLRSGFVEGDGGSYAYNEVSSSPLDTTLFPPMLPGNVVRLELVPLMVAALTLEADAGTQHIDAEEGSPAYDSVGFSNVPVSVGFTPFGTGYAGTREWASLNNDTDVGGTVSPNSLIRLNTSGGEAFKSLRATIAGQEFMFDVIYDAGEAAFFGAIPHTTLPYTNGGHIKLEFFNETRTQDTSLEFTVTADEITLASGDTAVGYDIDGHYTGATSTYGTFVSGPAGKLRAIYTQRSGGVPQYNTFMVWSTAFAEMDTAEIRINGGAPETVPVSVDTGNSFFAFDFSSEIAIGDSVNIKLFKA